MVRIYDFKCNHCEISFEKEVDYKDILKVKCPSCHRTARKVIVTSTPIKFVGKGWYSNDFKNKEENE